VARRLTRSLLGITVMPRRSVEKDLFGKPIKRRRPRYEAALEGGDRATLPTRAERVRWLEAVVPRRYGFAMPLETFYVFEEAKASFVYGQFVATVLLAASFAEHWLTASLSSRGFTKDASRGLAASVACARSNRLINEKLLEKVDRLRLIRNPFVHLKSFEHKHGISQRFFRQRLHPKQVLEQDAKDALVAMYAVAVYAFKNT
jgi:hypothetical protein